MTKINKTRHQLSRCLRGGVLMIVLAVISPWFNEFFICSSLNIITSKYDIYDKLIIFSNIFQCLLAAICCMIFSHSVSYLNPSQFINVPICKKFLILLFGSELINSSATAICCRIFSSSSCNLIFLNSNCDFFSVYIG